MADSKKLHPGSHARIYRDGTELQANIVLLPIGKAALELRGLTPGSYVARDELGGEQAFVVDPKSEVATIHVGGATEGSDNVAVGPGAAQLDEVDHLLVGPPDAPPDPIYPKVRPQGDVAFNPEHDIPVLGEPGSALIEEVGEPVVLDDPGTKKKDLGTADEQADVPHGADVEQEPLETPDGPVVQAPVQPVAEGAPRSRRATPRGSRKK